MDISTSSPLSATGYLQKEQEALTTLTSRYVPILTEKFSSHLGALSSCSSYGVSIDVHYKVLCKLANELILQKNLPKPLHILVTDNIQKDRKYDLYSDKAMDTDTPKIYCIHLNNESLERVWELNDANMSGIRGRMMKDMKDSSIPLTTTWKFGVKGIGPKTRAEIIDLLTKKGLKSALEQPQGSVELEDGNRRLVCIERIRAQFVSTTLEPNATYEEHPTYKSEFSAKNLLITRRDFSQSSSWEKSSYTLSASDSAKQKLMEISKELEFIASEAPCLRTWSFNVQDISEHAQALVLKEIQNLGYQSELREPFRVMNSSAQELIVCLPETQEEVDKNLSALKQSSTITTSKTHAQGLVILCSKCGLSYTNAVRVTGMLNNQSVTLEGSHGIQYVITRDGVYQVNETPYGLQIIPTGMHDCEQKETHIKNILTKEPAF